MSTENYRLDGEARALYYADYRAAYEVVREKLSPWEVIPADMLVSFVGNEIVYPNALDLKNSDRLPMGKFVIPGKSASIAFTTDINVACCALFDRAARRSDGLYIVTASSLEELNFFPFYTPLSNLPLHLSVVHANHIQDPTLRDSPYKDKVALAALLNANKIG